MVSTKVGDPFDEKSPGRPRQHLCAGLLHRPGPADIGSVRRRRDHLPRDRKPRHHPGALRGNQHVPADTLLALMDTAPVSLQPQTYQQDVLKINSYYDKIGYGGQLPTHVADVNDQPQGMLTLKIREGLMVRNVIISDRRRGRSASDADRDLIRSR